MNWKGELLFFIGEVKHVYEADDGRKWAHIVVPPCYPGRGTAELPVDEIEGGPPTPGSQVAHYCFAEIDETGGRITGRRLEMVKARSAT